MLKRIMVALAGLFVMLGLAAAPASGSGASGIVTLYEQAGLTGDFVEVQELQIPTSCAAIPVNLSTIRSADNATTGPGTSVDFFASTDTTCSSAIQTVEPGWAKDIVDPADTTQGAGFWMVSP